MILLSIFVISAVLIYALIELKDYHDNNKL
jgi:hypothetical protein